MSGVGWGRRGGGEKARDKAKGTGVHERKEG